MEILYDETYTSEDGKRASRNIWYGNVNVYVDGEHGKTLCLDQDFVRSLCEKMKNELSKNLNPPPTETNWYFYEGDVIAENVSPVIMVREKAGLFITHFNISDHDFAVNIDAILLFKADFEKCLASIVA